MIVWQDPPPYVQYMAEAEEIGRMSYAAGICAGAGIIVADQKSVEEVANAFQRRAVIARVWGPVVESAVLQGIEAEKADFLIISEIPDGLSAEQEAARVDDVIDYLTDRCGRVVRDYPEVGQLAPE